MKTISTNSYNINWGDYLSDDALKFWENLNKYYIASNEKGNINIIIINNYPSLNNNEADPCLTCPNRDGPKDAFGNPVIGDSPCQWCRHYKWRITW